MEYPAEISKALSNASVAQLFNAVQAVTPVEFLPSDDKLWGSSTALGSTTIFYATSKHPAEALAHELLHAELKNAGFRQHRFAVAKRPCSHLEAIRGLLGILDNELQHHRMAARFASLGLNPKWFYHDDDVNAYKKVRRAVEQLSSTNATADFFTQFVTVIAPGGAGAEVERTRVKNFLKMRCGARTAKKLDEIEAVFVKWASADALDAAPFINEIFSLLDLQCAFWVGSSTAFPEGGFFIGGSFEVQEAEPYSGLSARAGSENLS